MVVTTLVVIWAKRLLQINKITEQSVGPPIEIGVCYSKRVETRSG